MEKEIEDLEKKVKELEDSFSIPGPTPLGTLQERTRIYNETKSALDEKTERWLILEEKTGE